MTAVKALSDSSAFPALTGAGTATGDLFPIYDVSAAAFKSITRAEMALAIAAEGAFVAKSGDTMTGQLAFSGTTHAGLKLNNLTTTQKNALTAAAGMAVYDTTLARPSFYENGAWHDHVRRDGDTMTGDLLFTDASYDIGKSGATRPRHIYASGNIVAGGTYNGYTPMNVAGDTMTGDLKFTDATYDIGKSGATRPRHGYFSGNIVAGGTVTGSNVSTTAPTSTWLGYTDGASHTYTVPAGVKWLRVVMKAAGGGGGGAANGTTTTAGTDGSDLTFAGFTAAGGKGAPALSSGGSSVGGLGGAGSQVGNEKRTPGAPGGWGMSSPSSNSVFYADGHGGGGPLGALRGVTSTGNAAVAGTGRGGGGAFNQAGANYNSAPGGGEGETVEFIVAAPSSSYSYTIADGGAAGTSTSNGGKGGSGYIWIEEHYNN